MNKRKPNRLTQFDYSNNGVYFITICTKDKQCILWKTNSVGADIIRPNSRILSEFGEIVYSAILDIEKHYNYVSIEKFVVMPNHIHLLLMIDNGGRIISAPTKTVSTFVGQLKRSVSKTIGKSIWQKSFYDHVIRDRDDFLVKWKYIDENPLKWHLDKYF